MKEEEPVPDHMLISRGGFARRTLEQIEQDKDLGDYGEDNNESIPNDDDDEGDDDPHNDDDDMMDSQESAADNDLKDMLSNLNPIEPVVPKGGFFNMVEHPSIHDDANTGYDDDCLAAYDHDEFEDQDDESVVHSGRPSTGGR